jgi:hypothetical protein
MSRNNPGSGTRKSIREAQDRMDYYLARAVPRNHRFTIFRRGEDICAKCGKPRAKHV